MRPFQVYILVRIQRIKKVVMQISEVRGHLDFEIFFSAMADEDNVAHSDSGEGSERNNDPPSGIPGSIV
jgi:hypothetical protein